MKKILIFTLAAVLLTACGGSGGDSSGNSGTTPGTNPGKGDTSMVINQQYVVSPGDKIIKDSNLTRVKITHAEGQTNSTAELIEGSATLRQN